jgi:hypothetical protein
MAVDRLKEFSFPQKFDVSSTLLLIQPQSPRSQGKLTGHLNSANVLHYHDLYPQEWLSLNSSQPTSTRCRQIQGSHDPWDPTIPGSPTWRMILMREWQLSLRSGACSTSRWKQCQRCRGDSIQSKTNKGKHLNTSVWYSGWKTYNDNFGRDVSWSIFRAESLRTDNITGTVSDEINCCYGSLLGIASHVTRDETE